MGDVEKLDVIDASLVEAVLADMGQDGMTATAPAAPLGGLVDPGQALDLAARVAMLEAQSNEQGAALRRVLSLLVEWVEGDAAKPDMGRVGKTRA
jgi:general secretion pathway protein A